jgi:hypothetical protein
MSGGAMGKGDSVEPIFCQLPWSAQPDDKLHMFVLGYKVDADMENWEYDRSELVAPYHCWDVPFLPSPIVKVQPENTVSSEAGTLVLDVEVENSIEGGYLTVEDDWAAAWAVSSVVDGKVSVAYEANATALPRVATITVNYVKKVVDGDYEYEEPLASAMVTLTQEANPNVEKVTFSIEVVENFEGPHFDRLVVNVKPSNKEAKYKLSTVAAMAQDWETKEWSDVEINWLEQVNNTWSDEVHQGDLTNHVIKMNVSNYEWDGTEFYVYAFAVTEDGAAAGEASYARAKVDISDKPILTLVADENCVWDAENDRFNVVTPAEGGKVTVKFDVKNPVEGAFLKTPDWLMNNIIKDGIFEVDEENKTISFEVNPYDTTADEWSHYEDLAFFYTNENNDTWGATVSLRVTQSAPATR